MSGRAGTPCPQCGATRDMDHFYCKACRQAYQRKQRSKPEIREWKRYKDLKRYYERTGRTMPRQPPAIMTITPDCCQCGKTFERKAANQVTCSASCSKARHQHRSNIAKARRRAEAKGLEGPPMAGGPRPCSECGTVFQAVGNRAHAMTCKPECSKLRDARLCRGRARTERQQAKVVVKDLSASGIFCSGYREEAPRISTAPPLLSCPFCRGYGHHSDWCGERARA